MALANIINTRKYEVPKYLPKYIPKYDYDPYTGIYINFVKF